VTLLFVRTLHSTSAPAPEGEASSDGIDKKSPAFRGGKSMERRTFLAASATVAAGAAVAAAATVAAAAALPVEPAQAEALPLGNLPNWRYPDDRVEALDKRFKYPRQQ
jgi:hypothetical protein